ncbi:MAG: zinc ribbon domain-containing protein [Pirellula sp.]
MPVSDAIVRRLHELLSHIADLKGQIERGPKQIQLAHTQLKSAADAVAACKDAIKQKKMEADRKQLQQRERDAKLYEWQGKLNAASNNREFQAVKDQIAADTQANSVLSDEILEILETIDDLNAKLVELDAKQKLVAADTAKAEARIKERLATLNVELGRFQEELKSVEAELPEEFAHTYRSLVASRAEEAFAPLDDRSCGGCNTGLPPRIIDQLRMGHPVACSSCGRWIYRPE